MKFDFSVPMTGYEFIATLIAILALIVPFIEKIITFAFSKTKLQIYPTNQLKLLYNESGSYVTMDFSIFCKGKDCIVQNIEMEIIRKSDGKKLKLVQSYFNSPFHSRSGNTVLSSGEIAHPFMIKKDGIYNVFVEMAQKDSQIINKLNDIHQTKMSFFELSNNYIDDVERFKKIEKYNQYYATIYEEMFWKKSEFALQVIITYNKGEKYIQEYTFEVDEGEEKAFVKNVEEALIGRVKKLYQIPPYFYVGNKSFTK